MPCEVAPTRSAIGRIAVLDFGFALAGCGPHPDAARLQADAAEHHPGCRVFDSAPGEGEGDSDTVCMHIELRCDAVPIARKLEYAYRRERAGWRLTHRDPGQSHRTAPHDVSAATAHRNAP